MDFGPIDTLFKFVGILLLFAVPLAIWKMIEVAYWLWTHVSIDWS